MSEDVVANGSVLSGRYRLVEPLGSGGMGTVWRAVDQLLDREVAVKEVLLPLGPDDETRATARRRTFREAQAAARLRHPAIVTVYDVVEHDRRPWIVMELVPSRNLAEIVRDDGPLPPIRVAAIGLRVLDAMVTAEAAGVSHRDIKPANVLITDAGRVVLADFGIAKHVSDETITNTGLLIGSPDFLAPERARGLDSGLAADLWSLGATMYDAVEGRRPFARNGPLPTLAAVVMDEPPPPLRAGPLRPVIDGLLVKNPAHRLDADATRAMLQRVIRGRSAGGTVPVPLPWTTSRLPVLEDDGTELEGPLPGGEPERTLTPPAGPRTDGPPPDDPSTDAPRTGGPRTGGPGDARADGSGTAGAQEAPAQDARPTGRRLRDRWSRAGRGGATGGTAATGGSGPAAGSGGAGTAAGAAALAAGAGHVNVRSAPSDRPRPTTPEAANPGAGTTVVPTVTTGAAPAGPAPAGTAPAGTAPADPTDAPPAPRRSDTDGATGAAPGTPHAPPAGQRPAAGAPGSPGAPTADTGTRTSGASDGQSRDTDGSTGAAPTDTADEAGAGPGATAAKVGAAGVAAAAAAGIAGALAGRDTDDRDTAPDSATRTPENQAPGTQTPEKQDPETRAPQGHDADAGGTPPASPPPTSPAAAAAAPLTAPPTADRPAAARPTTPGAAGPGTATPPATDRPAAARPTTSPAAAAAAAAAAPTVAATAVSRPDDPTTADTRVAADPTPTGPRDTRPPGTGPTRTVPDPRDRRSRRPAVLAGLAVLLLLAAAAIIIPLVRPDDPGPQAGAPADTAATAATSGAAGPGPTTRTGSPPSPTSRATTPAPAPTSAPTSAPATPAPTTTPPPPNAPAGVPAGFTRYTDPQVGYSVVVPAGWRPERNGSRVDFEDPNTGRFLRLDSTSTPQDDPLQNWIDYEATYRVGKAGYRNLGIRSVNYGADKGWTSADWEFRIGDTHVLNRNVRVSDTRAHAIYWSSPESLWNSAESRRIFDLAARTFTP